MRKSTKFSPEVRERAVRVVLEHRDEHPPMGSHSVHSGQDWLRTPGMGTPTRSRCGLLLILASSGALVVTGLVMGLIDTVPSSICSPLKIKIQRVRTEKLWLTGRLAPDPG